MTDAAEYCRAIETYLCRKNEGHLVRIVGPVFEQVSGWAAQGVPLAVAFQGIDRYCTRYHAKGPRRRPVRIEFCERDILELFDGWRRAVGAVRQEDHTGSAPVARDTLPAHLDRAIARLTALRVGDRSAAFRDRVDGAVRELDAMRGGARSARGEARAALVARLDALDRELLETAQAELDERRRAAMRSEAEADIAPFAARMSPASRARAVHAAYVRLVRDGLHLPTLGFEP